MIKLSVVLATYNEERNLQKCLDSIRDIADEIVIVDGQSQDDTVNIAKKFKARIFLVENQPLFHINKQIALEKAKGKWILQLDADEVVTDALRQEILETVKQDKQIINGYYIPRKNYFLGRWMRKGGLYPDGVIRLVRKGKAFFPCQSVHEQIRVEGKVGWLKNPLLHYSYPTLKEYLKKANRYTTLTALQLKKDKVKINFQETIKYCFFIPLKTFFSILIRHQGFLDGIHGFLWAFFSSMHYFLAYAKLLRGIYENSR